MKRFLILMLIVSPIAAQQKEKKDPPPRPLFAMPLAIDPGKSTKLTLRGQNLDTVSDIRVQEPKSTGKIIGKGRKVGVGNQQSAEIVGDSEIDVEILVPKEVAGGLLGISLIGPGGESKPCVVAINDETPRVVEKEPNDGFKQAMPVSVPMVIEGGFKQAQDVDVFRLEAKANEEYSIAIQSKRLGSPAEVLMTVYNAEGRTISTGEVTSDNPDQSINISVTKEGVYFISLLEANDQGGNIFNYRLVVRKKR